MSRTPVVFWLLSLALALPPVAQARGYRRGGPSMTAFGPVYNFSDAGQVRQYQQLMQRQQQMMMREYQAEMKMQQQYLKLQQQYLKQQQDQAKTSGTNPNQAQQALGFGTTGRSTRTRRHTALKSRTSQEAKTPDQATATDPIDPNDPFGLNKTETSEPETKTRRTLPTNSTSSATTGPSSKQ